LHKKVAKFPTLDCNYTKAHEYMENIITPFAKIRKLAIRKDERRWEMRKYPTPLPSRPSLSHT
jgi:hypothetical protein